MFWQQCEVKGVSLLKVGGRRERGYVISTGNPRSLPGTEFFGI